MPDASWVHMLRLSNWTTCCNTIALAWQQGRTAQHACQTEHGWTEQPVPDRPTTAETSGPLLCCGLGEIPCCRLAHLPCAAGMQRSARVLLLNPLGLLLAVPPDSGLQALRHLDVGQRACIWVSSGLLLTGLFAADP